jgi:hypothetical protein
MTKTWDLRKGGVKMKSHTYRILVAHDDAVWQVAERVKGWLDRSGLYWGFTCYSHVGGGGKWPIEYGTTVELAGLESWDKAQVRELAQALRIWKEQEAVLVLTSREEFTSVDKYCELEVTG